MSRSLRPYNLDKSGQLGVDVSMRALVQMRQCVSGGSGRTGRLWITWPDTTHFTSYAISFAAASAFHVRFK